MGKSLSGIPEIGIILRRGELDVCAYAYILNFIYQSAVMSETAVQAQPAFLFIPDISGFTEFVNNTEIHHARHIVEELLEIIIDANEIGLEVSEIEGDAILFYRNGQAPTAAALLAQVQNMYVKFKAHLRKYESHRICQCGACSSANRLALKFVAHFGEITTKTVKDHSKLFGKEVIVVHRLLKNSIEQPEYILITDSLIQADNTWIDLPTVAWSDVDKGSAAYEYGTTNYSFLSLTPLQDHVPDPKIEDFALPNATQIVATTESVINAPLDMVFNVLSDVSFRQEWEAHVNVSDRPTAKISQEGIAHRCIVAGDPKVKKIVTHDFKRVNDVIHFTDTNHKEGYCIVFTLRKIGPNLTRVSANFLMKPNWFKKKIFDLMIKKKLLKTLERNWTSLDSYCKKLVMEGKNHRSQIILKDQADRLVPQIP